MLSELPDHVRGQVSDLGDHHLADMLSELGHESRVVLLPRSMPREVGFLAWNARRPLAEVLHASRLTLLVLLPLPARALFPAGAAGALVGLDTALPSRRIAHRAITRFRTFLLRELQVRIDHVAAADAEDGVEGGVDRAETSSPLRVRICHPLGARLDVTLECRDASVLLATRTAVTLLPRCLAEHTASSPFGPVKLS